MDRTITLRQLKTIRSLRSSNPTDSEEFCIFLKALNNKVVESLKSADVNNFKYYQGAVSAFEALIEMWDKTDEMIDYFQAQDVNQSDAYI